MSHVDWEDVRHFTALASTLHLARAAAELGTSQVTVMRRVKTLEDTLGTTLFIRRRDGHRLTPAGAELLRSTGEAAHLIEGGSRRVVARDTRPGGRVRIATTELAANWILLPALPAFLAANPDIVLEIDASPDALGLTDDIETIALRFRRPQHGALRIRRLGEIAFSLYRRAHHPPAKDRYIGWAGQFAEIGLARWLRRVHGDVIPALTLTTFEGHLKAVRDGLGASALPDFLARTDQALAAVDSELGAFRLEAWLVTPEAIAPFARVRRTARFIEAAVLQATMRQTED